MSTVAVTFGHVVLGSPKQYEAARREAVSASDATLAVDCTLALLLLLATTQEKLLQHDCVELATNG